MYSNYNTKKEKSQEQIDKQLLEITDKKKQAALFVDSFERIGKKRKAERLDSCGTYLEFWTHKENGKTRLHKANFCKVRLCPLCAARRSKELFSEASKMFSVISSKYHYSFLFVTLTVRSCKANEVGEVIDNILNAFCKLTKRRKTFEKILCGYWRALEITYNQTDDTYHPHLRCVLAVPPHYFSDPKLYISQELLCSEWKSVLGVDYIPVCDIRAVKGLHHKSVSEVTKYTVKSFELIVRASDGRIDDNKTDEVINTIDNALRGRRLIGLGGIFKIVKSDIDDINDTTQVEFNELDYFINKYYWNVGATQYIEI